MVIIFSGCFKKNEHNNIVIDLPETKKITNFNQWAVIKYSLLKLRAAPEKNSKIITYIPQPVVVKIIKKNSELEKFENEKNYWYNIDYNGETGWMFGSFITIFNNYEEAQKKCEELLLNLYKDNNNSIDNKKE